MGASYFPEDLDDFYPKIELAVLLSENWQVVKLMEFLAQTADVNAYIAVALLEKSLKQDRGTWFLAGRSVEIEKILSTAMISESSEARSSAVRVINLFGERGEERYRELLRLR